MSVRLRYLRCRHPLSGPLFSCQTSQPTALPDDKISIKLQKFHLAPFLVGELLRIQEGVS